MDLEDLGMLILWVIIGTIILIVVVGILFYGITLIEKENAKNIDNVEIIIDNKKQILTNIDYIDNSTHSAYIYLKDGTEYKVQEYKINYKKEN